ncbi:hypothetical protein C2G38_2148923 [Gigaspora rosea]|uniref:Uncharacterized protein n=1 Tax=Gigaspora rosea TaxID=44941 RepID=A0A397U378_9GLOM|nr:hypothetical protein C2G38_2148923 [Gigaspora rosea]
MEQTKSSRSSRSKNLQGPESLSNSAFLFNTRDVSALKARFCSTTSADDVIPDKTVDIPQEYVLPDIDRAVLNRADLDISRLSTNDYVRAFIHILHKIVKHAKLDIGTGDSLTDSLVADLIYNVLAFSQWPLKVELHPTMKLFIGHVILPAKAEFAISNKYYYLLFVEDKYLTNVRPDFDYGEPQILAEMLACGEENLQRACKTYTMNMFVVRVISTYVTFYRATIHKEYWDELGNGCPRRQSLTIFRWPGNSSNPFLGFDLADPNGRRTVLESLCKIRQYILDSLFFTIPLKV